MQNMMDIGATLIEETLNLARKIRNPYAIAAVLMIKTPPTESLFDAAIEEAYKSQNPDIVGAVLAFGAQPTEQSLDLALTPECSELMNLQGAFIVDAVLAAGAQPTERSPDLARNTENPHIVEGVQKAVLAAKIEASKCEIEKNAQELRRHGDNPATLFGSLPQELNLEIAKRTRDYDVQSEKQAHDIAVEHFCRPKV